MVDREDAVDEVDREEIEGEGENEQGKTEQTEAEKQARALGWVPEEEWDEERAEKSGRRKPSKFVSADEFLKRQEDNPGMERERLRSATRMIDNLTKKIDEFGKIFDSQRRMNLDAQKRAYEKGLADAEERFKEAVADGDVSKAQEIRGEIDEIKENKAKVEVEVEEEPSHKPQGRDPRIVAWEKANPWYFEDEELKGAMRKEHSRLIHERPGVPQADLLDEALEAVKRRHPEAFGEKEKPNPRRQAAPAVNGSTGNRRAPAGNGRTFADVPEADKAAFRNHQKMMKSRGIEYTEKQFLEEYQW